MSKFIRRAVSTIVAFSIILSMPMILNASENLIPLNEDSIEYVHKWTKNLNAHWGGIPTFNEDGSMYVSWPGTAGGGGRQNQFASRFAEGGSIANEAIAKAQLEGRTIEFTVKYISGSHGEGKEMRSVQVLTASAIGSAAQGIHWVSIGEEVTIKIDVSGHPANLNSGSILQLLVQNYGVTNMHDVEIWISPVIITPITELNTVTIINGTSSGAYQAGESVFIVADAPADGQVFDRWVTSDDVVLTNAYRAATTFTVPNHDVTIMATYRNYFGIPQGFNQTVSEFAEGITLGWNLGNTLDTSLWHNEPVRVTQPEMEMYWGNPITTRAMIEEVRNAGFDAIRIPITWRLFTGPAPDYIIRDDLMLRVIQLVDYAIDLDMHVIINVHHDDSAGGWLIAHDDYKDTALNRLEILWNQIAAVFIDYDERLIFEGMNEVGASERDHSEGTPESRAIINEYNQRFVETVRSTGGNNAYRYLMVKTNGGSNVAGAFEGFVMPDDDRLILSVHIYQGHAPALERTLIRLKSEFIDLGIPVFIGEWGFEDTVTYDRAAASYMYMSLVNEYGLTSFLWDDGGKYQLLNRRELTWQHPDILNAIMAAISKEFGDPLETLHRWEARLDANWGGVPTFNEDGSVNVIWPGRAGHNGHQNGFASHFALGGDRANAVVNKAIREGRTIEFTVKLVGGTSNANDDTLHSVNFITRRAIPMDNWKLINNGEETTIIIEPADLPNNLGEGLNNVIHVLLEDFRTHINMHDVEIWISPIIISPRTDGEKPLEFITFGGTSHNELQRLLNEGNNVKITTPGNFGISANNNIVIPAGVTLKIETVLNVRPQAVLNVEGTLIVAPGGRINNDYGGNHPPGGTIRIAHGGVLINDGHVENVSYSTFFNNGTIINNGIFAVRAFTTFTNSGTIGGNNPLNIHRDAIVN